MNDQNTGTDNAAPAAAAEAPAALPQAAERPAVGDVTPRGTVFGVRVHEGETFVQFSEAGEWLPA